MSSLRRQLPRLAALVLLVWLLAAGSAFAQACASSAHLACDECCTHADPAVPSAAPTLPAGAEQAAPIWPAASTLDMAQIGAVAAVMLRPPPRDAAPPRVRIPIAFLRLAL